MREADAWKYVENNLHDCVDTQHPVNEMNFYEEEISQLQPMWTAESFVDQLEEWLADLEDNGMPAQCSTRVLLKAKEELGLLETEDSERKTGDDTE